MNKTPFNKLVSLLRRRWQQFEWPVIIFLGILSVVSGYIGLSRHLPAGSESSSVSNILYRILQMFFVDSGYMEGVEPPICWELDLARFLAPLTITYTALQALGVLFLDQIRMLRLMMTRNHTIICGLGGKGEIIASRFLEGGTKVVIIELDDENDVIPQMRLQGAVVLSGNASDPAILVRAGVRRAKHLICVCGDDGINTAIAVTTRRLCINTSPKQVLNCITHIVDSQLCQLLPKYEIESVDEGSYSLDFFNVYESGSGVCLKSIRLRAEP